jgi:glucose-6-phosphate isomerase
MAEPYWQDVSFCLARRGEPGHIGSSELAEGLAAAWPAVLRLREAYRAGTLPLLRLPERRDDLPALRRAARRLRRSATTLVLGIGGSSLGGQALVALSKAAPHLPPSPAPTPVFLENIDPIAFEPWLAHAARGDTAFVVVSKSGSTAETLSQALAAWHRLAAAVGNGKAAERFLVITEPGDNPLRRWAARRRIETLDHDPGIGGRYAVLSLVGVVPALVAGLDPVALRQGAHQVLKKLLRARDPGRIPPAVGAAINLALARKGKTIQVVMPYAQALRPFALWHAQLWAESLGKAGHGTTPVAALGPVDQHSQLQSWLGGPQDKLFTLIQIGRAGTGPLHAGAAEDAALGYLARRRMGDLLEAEQRATAVTLMRRGCPVRVFRLPTLDERALGALFMHFFLETILAGDLLGIDPFDQPAVEEGKILARRYLSEMRRKRIK